MMNKNWFANWFDSAYYHILYKNRNEAEAELFIQNLVNYLQVKPLANILDLACGKGRHSIFLHKLGFDVTGLDLSKNSIAHAQQFANEHLHFAVQDMRQVNMVNYYDLVCNLFTSFGYFANNNDNILAAKAMVAACKIGGTICIDFINSTKAIAHVKANPTMEIIENDIRFAIHKKVENQKFIKTINVYDGTKPVQHFAESVQALQLTDFKNIFEKLGVQLIQTFGDYQLNAFNESESPRLIMLFKK